MDAIKLLKRDHSLVQSLFNRFDRTGRNSFDQKFDLYDEIRTEFELHTHTEEEIFYPIVKAAGPQGKDLIGRAMKDHKESTTLIGQIDRLTADDPNFDDKVQALFEAVERHIQEEEREIFVF